MQTPLREFQHTKGALLPSFKACLRSGDSGQPIDLTPFASVKFRMVDMAGTVKIDGADAAFEDKPNGLVRYDWQSGDVDTLDRYHCWFILVDGTGKEEPFPTGEKLVMEFVDG